MRRVRLACAAAVAVWPLLAPAAGGHHAVDDAALLEPGQCELESWLGRAGGGERLLHAGAGCRLGPVELGAAGEYTRFSGGSQTGWGLSAKWAQEVAPGWSMGASVAPAWAARVRPRYQGTTLAALASWSAREDLALHLNIGRDLVHRAGDQARYGVSAEWTPAQNWALLAERYKESETHFVRGGLRWAGGAHWSVDLSRAQRLAGPGASTWTLGATWLLDRR